VGYGKGNDSELVAEARLANLELSAVDVLRRLVDQFGGKAELLYRNGEWSFLVRGGSGEEAPFEAPHLPAEDYDAPGPVPPEGFAENEVEKAAKRTLGLAEKP